MLVRSGIAGTAGDVAALEAAVGDETVVVLRRKHLLQARLQRRRTARAVRGAEVHVRQATIEQERQLAADRMAFPQHRAAMPGANARQFALQRLVVRTPDRKSTRLNSSH